MTNKKADIFIADAHIMNSESECAKKLIRFLDHIKDKTRTLYLLGDIFDFWFGANRAFHDSYRKILDKFLELKERGVNYVFIEGNHEVYMGKFFSKKLEALVSPVDAFLEVDGKKLYITHGDTIDYTDKAHIFSKGLLRSIPLHILMRITPPRLILPISRRISGTSRNYSVTKKDFRSEIIDEFFTDKCEQGADFVVFAHTHKQMIEKRGDTYLINPGAFADNGSYARYEAGRFSLEHFSL